MDAAFANPRVVIVLSVAAVAAICDVRTRRIPNALTFGTAIVGLGYHLVFGGLAGLGASAAGLALGLLAFLLPFALGGTGGGDVKLVAALGAWLGPQDVIWVALYAGAAGGVMALVVALATGYLSTALRNVGLLLMHWRIVGLEPVPELTLRDSRSPRLAFAVPILAGVVATLWLR